MRAELDADPGEATARFVEQLQRGAVA